MKVHAFAFALVVAVMLAIAGWLCATGALMDRTWFVMFSILSIACWFWVVSLADKLDDKSRLCESLKANVDSANRRNDNSCMREDKVRGELAELKRRIENTKASDPINVENLDRRIG